MVRHVTKSRKDIRGMVKNSIPFFSFLMLVILTTVTFLVVSSRDSTDLRSRADVGDNTNIIFVDQQGVPVTKTNDAFVNVQITSPWAQTALSGESFEEVAGIQDVLGTTSTILSVKASADDANEDGNIFSTNTPHAWIGNGQSTSSSFTGYRFSNVNIPRGAIINSAKLLVFTPQQQWIQIRMDMRAEKIGNSAEFSSSSKLSQRSLTNNRTSHNSNTRWNANTWYDLGDLKSVVQEVVNQASWSPGNSLSIIMKGTGKSYGRKMVASFDSDKANSPRLVVNYTDLRSIPSATTTPIPTKTPQPTITSTSTQSVTSFSLINADTDQVLSTLTSGSTIDLTSLQTKNLNIRANTNPSVVGSVRMVLSGTTSHSVTEGVAPYALFGDTNGNFNNWTPMSGSYTLSATPYTSAQASGTAGTPLTITFSVTQSETPTPTAIPFTVQYEMSEDPNFVSNTVRLPYDSHPLMTSYTFTDATPGRKTLYVRFTSNTGEKQTFSNWIDLQQLPTATPTPVVTNSLNSQAMGKWSPSKWDTCTKEEHDSYFVLGPDGKKYPTWHPVIHRRADGSTCTFGHDHGRNPADSMVWKQVKEYFYYDANKNGQLDPAEEASAGVPFGYVNEQMDVYFHAQGKMTHRHEDHVGHKLEYANDETDMATHVNSTTKNTGVWIGKNGSNGVIEKDTGVRCFFLAKVHQGTSSPDAFMNNLHEVFYFSDCRHSDSTYNQKVSLAHMVGFGETGGFTNFMPMCNISRRSQPQDRICPLGKDSGGKCITTEMNKDYPSHPGGDREIISRECVEQGFLVPDGQWSGIFYEAWPANPAVTTTSGKRLLHNINLLFDVLDANRYYYPENLKQLRGYNNPAAGTNLGYSMDLCYDTSLLSQGRKYRGGTCDWATKYGSIKDITWDDPRSAFRGLHRGMYFQPAIIENQGGPEYWYTDPYGRNAQTSPFPGAIKQQISPKNLNYSDLIGGAAIDPRVNLKKHDSGNGTVHAPN